MSKAKGKRGLCTNCSKRPIYVVSRGLCSCCYQKSRTASLQESSLKNEWDYQSPPTFRRKEHEAEIIFIAEFFKHRNWIHHPALFNLGGNIRYTPDFYDGTRNVFIEVVGSRQAFHQNRDKYRLFVEKFPKLSFEIRDRWGAIYREISELHVDFRTKEYLPLDRQALGVKEGELF